MKVDQRLGVKGDQRKASGRLKNWVKAWRVIHARGSHAAQVRSECMRTHVKSVGSRGGECCCFVARRSAAHLQCQSGAAARAGRGHGPADFTQPAPQFAQGVDAEASCTSEPCPCPMAGVLPPGLWLPGVPVADTVPAWPYGARLAPLRLPGAISGWLGSAFCRPGVSAGGGS